jgi:signal transduction histidine kinase
MNLPAAPPTSDTPLRPLGNTVGFWREDFTVRSFSLEPQWRAEHGVALHDGADSAVRWLQLVHPEDRLSVSRAQQSMMTARHADMDIEYRVMARERGWFWVAQRGQIVDRGQDGRPRTAAGVIIDIDGEKRARIAQRVAEAQRDVALWGGDLGLYDWNLLTDGMRWLHGWETRTDVDAIAGLEVSARWLALTHPDDRALLGAALQDFRTGRVPELQVEYRLRSRAGQWLWLVDRARVIDLDSRGQPWRAMGVRQVVDELARLRLQARDVADTQRQFEKELLDVASREQERMGSELHDGLGQELTGAALMLQACLRDLRAGDSPQAAAVGEVLAQLNCTIENTRTLARGLWPLATGPGGLVSALANLAARLDRHSGLQIRFVNRLAQYPPLPPSSAHHLLRIAQEAVTNTLKHSGATDVVLELGQTEEGIYLCVRDNGRGFPDAIAPDNGMGMRLMQYRARLLGGDLRTYSAQHQGVTITCRCPVHSSASHLDLSDSGDLR